MFNRWFRDLAAKWTRQTRRSGRLPWTHRRPQLEQLEDRIAPATRTWDGGSLRTSNWTDRVNWVGDIAPVAGDDLIFPTGAARLVNTDNFADNTQFRSITFIGSGYTILTSSSNTNRIQIGEGGITDSAASGTNTIQGAVNLALGNIEVSNSGATLELAGTLSGVPSNWSKLGAGTLVLSHANTFTGVTFVFAGVLRLQADGALGSTVGKTVVENGASLELAGASIAESLELNGTGVGGAGVLRNLSGANFLTGSNISLGTPTVTLNVGVGSQLTINSVLAGPSGTNLNKIGTGTLVLNAANTYQGLTSINQGTVRLHNNQALGVTSAGTTIAAGASLELQEFIPPGAEFPLSLSVAEPLLIVGGSSLETQLHNLSGDNKWTGPISILSGNATIGVDPDGASSTTDQLTITGAISGSQVSTNLVKLGAGRLILTAANDYNGPTAVRQGVVRITNSSALGSAGSGTSVFSGAALELQDVLIPGPGGTVESLPLNVAEPLALGSLGVNFTEGGLRNLRGANTWSGGITLTADAAIGTEFPSQLTLTLPLTGTFNLAKRGPGTLTLAAGSNPLTGRFDVFGGTVRVNGSLQSSETRLIGTPLLEAIGPVKALTAFGGTVSPGVPGTATAVLNAQGNVNLEGPSTFSVQIFGTTAGSQYDQLNVTGTVTLLDHNGANPTLNASVGFNAAVGDKFVLINNDGTDAVTGNFKTAAGTVLGEGTTLSLNGQLFQISYAGGTNNNDVVLTRINTPPMITDVTLTSELNEGGYATLAGRLVDPDARDVLRLDVDWGDRTVETFRPGTDPFTVRHQYLDSGTFQVHFTWSDNHGGHNDRTLPVIVHNVAPVLGNLLAAVQGSHVSLQGTISDPGLVDSFTLLVDWGDGSSNTYNLAAGTTSFSADHDYQKSGTYRITVTVTDDDGGTASQQARVKIGSDRTAFSLTAEAVDNVFASGFARA